MSLKTIQTDKKGLQAIKQSIRKWELIAYYGGIDRRAENCPLCNMFMEKKDKEYIFYMNVCNKCPVYLDSNGHHCGATPYKLWIYHHAKDHGGCGWESKVECPECKKIAEEEIIYLKQLEEKYCVDMWRSIFKPIYEITLTNYLKNYITLPTS